MSCWDQSADSARHMPRSLWRLCQPIRNVCRSVISSSGTTAHATPRSGCLGTAKRTRHGADRCRASRGDRPVVGRSEHPRAVPEGSRQGGRRVRGGDGRARPGPEDPPVAEAARPAAGALRSRAECRLVVLGRTWSRPARRGVARFGQYLDVARSVACDRDRAWTPLIARGNGGVVLNRIIVPTDGSDYSWRAVAVGDALARQCDDAAQVARGRHLPG